jgi:DNA polymerase/3'-5' exonuclease PolX
VNVKLFCYRKGAEHMRKEIEKLERTKAKLSDQLFRADDSNSTVRQRANLRVRLSSTVGELDRKREYLAEIERLIDEEAIK